MTTGRSEASVSVFTKKVVKTFFQIQQKDHSITYTTVYKTEVLICAKHVKVFKTSVFSQNHGILVKLQKY